MPDDVRNLCRLADISSKSLLLQILRQGDREKMIALIERLTRDGKPTRQGARNATRKAKPGRPHAYTFKYRPPTKAFSLQLRFRKADVERDELISALESIIADLRQAS